MAIEDVVAALLTDPAGYDLAPLPSSPPTAPMKLMGSETPSRAAPVLPAMKPRTLGSGSPYPRPADLFGPAPLPYPSRFYDPGFAAPFSLSPEEQRIDQQLQAQQNQQVASLMPSGFGMGIL